MNLIEARRGKELKIRVTRDPWFAKEEKRIKTPEISARMDEAEGLLKKLDFDTLFDQFNDHYLEGRGSEFQVKSIHLFYRAYFLTGTRRKTLLFSTRFSKIRMKFILHCLKLESMMKFICGTIDFD